MSNYETKVETGIDSICVMIEMSDYVEHEALLNGLSSMFNKFGVRVINSKDKFVRNIWISNKQLGSIKFGSYAEKDVFGNLDINIIKYYVTIGFNGLKSYIDAIDVISFKCVEELFGTMNVFNIPYKIIELDIYTDITCDMSKLLSFCSNKLPKTKYFPLDHKFYHGDTVYIEDISGDNLGNYMRRAYMYNKAKKERMLGDMTRFEIKLQRPFFTNKFPSLLNLWNTMRSYKFMYFHTIEEKAEFMTKYNSYEQVRARDLKRMDIKHYAIHMDVNQIEGTLYYLETYKVPLIADGMKMPLAMIVERAKWLERELFIHTTITTCIVKVMESTEVAMMLSVLVDICVEKIFKEHKDLLLTYNQIDQRVREIVLKGNF